ncbi:cardiac-enriched FHL2-interacting protein-like [Acipenser ruthenus]|uniref:cardiac-enriched FHL2-interacting protein-like n=1 Tax=Acipenser ruthenus TaxID=7906 RepID=UPI0027408631|nr:cardiac-enriched FHL2-interacting protein-like [Acipenser ruthenus]XP_033886570.2 cardiac-enriched FHL2-interacting protein-like [Acipenser ruthenus]XP_033886571.2 cardiac-enriched FHL2-interacting protein-like [Acipenser ruthenus]
MSFLNNCHMSHRGSVQKHYKYMGGFSDMSSIGSFMDDTDREVSNLTDRAFRSLCIGEEAIYNDSDFAVSPLERSLAFIDNSQNKNPDILKKSVKERHTISIKSKEVEEKSEVAVTFQQSVRHSSKEAENCIKNDVATHLSNGVIGASCRPKKNISNVSSLIKAFGTVENDCDSSTNLGNKKCILAATKNDRMHKESDLWDKSALLSIEKELSEFSLAYQQNYTLSKKSDEIDRKKKNDNLLPARNNLQSPDMIITHKSKVDPNNHTAIPTKSKTSKGKRLSFRNCFLHSEYSPFRSWKDYNEFPFEKEDAEDLLPTNGIPKWYDSPVYKELTAVHRIRTPLNEDRKMLKHKKDDACITGCASSSVLQKASMLEKRSESEIGSTCPPWRRNRNQVPLPCPCTVSPLSEKYSRKEDNNCSFTKSTPTLHKVRTVVDGQIPSFETPSFNISKLLTPVIHARQDTETSEILQSVLSPPIIDLTTSHEHEFKAVAESKLRDSYKSMASSLLFNLKDNRKRVKSTYSPSTFRSHEVQDRSKQTSKQEVIPKNVPISSDPPANSSTQLQRKDITSTLQTMNSQITDTKEAAVCISDDYLTLSSPQTIKEAANYKGLSHVLQEGAIHKTKSVESESSINNGLDMMPCPRSNEVTLRKRPEYPSLKLYKKEDIVKEETKEIPVSIKNPLQSSSLRENDNVEKHTAIQNISSFHKTRTTPSFPLQESSVKHSPGVSCKGSTDGRTKPSKQSYLSLEGHQQSDLDHNLNEELTLRNGNGNNEKVQNNADETKKDIANIELQYYALSNHESEREREVESHPTPMRNQSTSPKEEHDLPSNGVEERSWVHCLIDDAMAYTPVSSSTASSPSSVKGNRFKVKDNTFRTSPVIKSVKAPLQKIFQEDVEMNGLSRNGSSPEKFEIAKAYYEEYDKDRVTEKIPLSGEAPVSSEDTVKGKAPVRSEGTVKGEAPVRSEGSVKGEARVRSEGTVKGEAPVRGEGSVKGEAPVRGESSVKGEAPVRSEGTVKGEAPVRSEGTVKGEVPVRSEGSVKGEAPVRSEGTVKGEAPVRSEGSVKGEAPVRSESSVKGEAPVRSEGSVKGEAPVRSEGSVKGEVPVTDEDECLIQLNSVRVEEESQLIVNAKLEDIESAASTVHMDEKVASAVCTKQAERSKDVSERSDSISSVSENKPLGKPPTVPPKTEKGLRRAKKLTNRRKKAETKPKTESTSRIEKKPIRTVSSVPSSPTHMSPSPIPMNSTPVPQPVHLERKDVSPVTNIVTAPVIQSFPITQRKLLQDPESGQYFVVDMPVQVKTKTFFDPETGKYIQLSIRSAEGGLSHASSLEVLNPPYVLYPGFLPLPVTSLPALRSTSEMSASATLMDDQGINELSEIWTQDAINQMHNQESHPYIEPVYNSHNQLTDGSMYSEEKEGSSPKNLDIIPMSELEDFAVESIL